MFLTFIFELDIRMSFKLYFAMFLFVEDDPNVPRTTLAYFHFGASSSCSESM